MKIALLLLMLIVSIMFGESNIISTKGFDDEIYKIGQSLLNGCCDNKNCVQPSFDCRGKLSEVEATICDSAKFDSIDIYTVLPFLIIYLIACMCLFCAIFRQTIRQKLRQ